MLKWGKELGDMYLVWVGMRPFIFLYKAEAIQPLLSSSVHIDKSLEYGYLRPWLGSGLVTSTGEYYKEPLNTIRKFLSRVHLILLRSSGHFSSNRISLMSKNIFNLDSRKIGRKTRPDNN